MVLIHSVFCFIVFFSENLLFILVIDLALNIFIFNSCTHFECKGLKIILQHLAPCFLSWPWHILVPASYSQCFFLFLPEWPLSLAMAILFSFPVLFNESQMTAIWGVPWGSGGVAVISNLPNGLLFLIIALAPFQQTEWAHQAGWESGQWRCAQPGRSHGPWWRHHESSTTVMPGANEVASNTNRFEASWICQEV